MANSGYFMLAKDTAAVAIFRGSYRAHVAQMVERRLGKTGPPELEHPFGASRKSQGVHGSPGSTEALATNKL